MNKNNRQFIIVAFTNIIIVCLVQIFYWTLLEESISMFIFQFLIFPLIFMLINILLWFSKFKLEFYQHALFSYIAFYVSVIVSLFLILDPSQELPPGEIVLFSDVLFVLITAAVQFIILLFLNFIIYIFYRIFLKIITNYNDR